MLHTTTVEGTEVTEVIEVTEVTPVIEHIKDQLMALLHGIALDGEWVAYNQTATC